MKILVLMGEFIVIQVGQCGNQIGSAFWPMALQEYGLTNTTQTKLPQHKSVNSFFHIEQGGSLKSCQNKIKARAVLIDMEDSVLARYKNGPLKKFFGSKCIVSNYPGSGNNWAEGFCCHGPQYKKKILKAIRRAVEKCDSIQGFLLFFSTSGGTGSGVGSFVLNLLADYYPDTDRFVACVYPLGTEDVITCPYNMALATQYLNEAATCVFPIENRALLDIVNTQLKETSSIETLRYVSGCQPYHDMNSIIANLLLHLTSGSRYNGKLNLDMSDIATNMIPFPQLNFISSGYSPLTVTSSRINPKHNSARIKDELFVNCIQRSNQLVKTQNKIGVTLAATILARGDFTASETQKYVIKLQQKLKFPPWCSKTVKIGLCDVPPYGHSLAMLSLQNNSTVSCLFSNILDNFNKLYKRKAHLHHYLNVDGFEEDYFKNCTERLYSVVENYSEIERMKPVLVPRITFNS